VAPESAPNAARGEHTSAGRIGRRSSPGKGSKEQFSARQSDDDQHIKQLKAEGGNHEQVHGRDVRRMVTQEGAPALRERLASLRHILDDGRLRHRKAELEPLTMNIRRAPKQVLNAHPLDQRPQICSDPRPPSHGARLPAPVAPKTSTMPAHEGLGPDDRHGVRGPTETNDTAG